MNCIRSLYKFLFRRKKVTIVKEHTTNLNSFLIPENIEPTYETFKNSSTV